MPINNPETSSSEGEHESLDELFEFDYWSRKKLDFLITQIKSRNGPWEDTHDPNWYEVANMIFCKNTSRNLALRLAESVNMEFRRADLRPIERDSHVYIGSFASAESRLIMLYFNIRKILYVCSHLADALWEADGIMYKTVVLDANNYILPHLNECLEFIGEPSGGRTFVCCSTGESRSAAICIAYIMHKNPDHSLETANSSIEGVCDFVKLNHSLKDQLMDYEEELQYLDVKSSSLGRSNKTLNDDNSSAVWWKGGRVMDPPHKRKGEEDNNILSPASPGKKQRDSERLQANDLNNTKLPSLVIPSNILNNLKIPPLASKVRKECQDAKMNASTGLTPRLRKIGVNVPILH